MHDLKNRLIINAVKYITEEQYLLNCIKNFKKKEFLKTDWKDP